jgi:hypothetical protein
MLLKHLDRVRKDCRTRVRFSVVEAINGNTRMLVNRDRGYKNMHYLLLKARAHGRYHVRTCRFSEAQESRVECHSLRIPAERALPLLSDCREWRHPSEKRYHA